jgi:hypothetical protein
MAQGNACAQRDALFQGVLHDLRRERKRQGGELTLKRL